MAHVKVTDQPAWRTNDHFHTIGQRALLIGVCHTTPTTIDGQGADRCEITKPLHMLRDLHGQFTGGHDNQCFYFLLARGRNDAMNNRQQEGSRFSGAGLRKGNHIAFINYFGYDLLLNRRRFIKLHGLNSFHDPFI